MRHTIESPLIKHNYLPKFRSNITHDDVLKIEDIKWETLVHELIYNSLSNEIKQKCKIDNSLFPFASTTYVFPVITGNTYMEVSLGREVKDDERTW